jgi:hypothetical protein
MKKLVLASVVVLVMVGVYSAVSVTRAGGARVMVKPADPAKGGVRGIVSAQPFLLERGWRHVWRLEQPEFDAGWLVVLEVDPEFAVARQVAEPVMYAGEQTVERVSFGIGSGRVVAIVPSARDASGSVALDLSVTPIWFGEAELPERVDAARVDQERARAAAKGVKPLVVPAVVVGEVLRLRSRDELDERAAVLVLENSPEEGDLGLGMLAPRVGVK